MKEKINEIINYGNSLLRKGTLLFGLSIKAKHIDEYNSKLRELKALNLESNKVIKELVEIEITDFYALIAREYKNPPGTFKKVAFSYWTGDLFFSKQTSIKAYIRNINMTLDLILHEL